jgi:serine/threonine-protein kinase
LSHLNRLLEMALVLEPDQRGPWLEGLSGEDAELRPLVAELLSHAATLEAKDFLGTLPRISASGLSAEPTGPSHQPGTVVGPYRLERELGRGGMGSVWLAERGDGTLRRKVALKLPHQGLSGPLLAQRLARERDILSTLEHPNIARLYDAGVAEDGQPYLALEYVEGSPIDRYCGERALGPGARLELFTQICRAVAHAHAHLVLHRDLKPSNILVTADGQVRLLDFGLAKLLEEKTVPAPETELTQLGGRALTPEYASPEQISGHPLTTASDVYSLGVVLYELLAGKRPYQLRRGSLGALEEAILTTDPVRPSRFATGAIRRAVAGDLDTIVLKALQKSPGARYATVNALLEDIERSRTGQPLMARPAGGWYRVRKLVQRHKVFVSAAAAVLAAVLLGAMAALWQARLAKAEAARAEASAREARFETRVARANQEFLSQIFGDAMRGGETEAMRARLDRARELLRRRYADEPVIHALLLLQLAGRYAELELPDRESEVMKEYDALAERTGDPSLLATRECIYAYDAIEGGDLEKARRHVARGLAQMARTARPWAIFECLRADGMLAMKSGDPARAVQRMRELLRRLEEDGLEKTVTYLSSLASLGYVYAMGGQFVEALDISRRKTALDATLGSDETIGAYVERDNTAEYLFALGRIAETRALDERLLADFQRTGSGEVPPPYFLNFAKNALAANDLERATGWLESLASRLEKTPSARGVLSTHFILADAYLRIGRLADAESRLARAEALARSMPAYPQWRVHDSRVRLALAERRGDHLAVRRELESLQAHLGAFRDPARASAHIRTTLLDAELEAGRALLGERDLTAAGGYAARALALARSAVLPGKTSAWVGAAELLEARVELAGGRAEEARRLASEASAEFADTLPSVHPLVLEAAAIASGADSLPRSH